MPGETLLFPAVAGTNGQELAEDRITEKRLNFPSRKESQTATALLSMAGRSHKAFTPVANWMCRDLDCLVRGYAALMETPHFGEADGRRGLGRRNCPPAGRSRSEFHLTPPTSTVPTSVSRSSLKPHLRRAETPRWSNTASGSVTPRREQALPHTPNLGGCGLVSRGRLVEAQSTRGRRNERARPAAKRGRAPLRRAQ